MLHLQAPKQTKPALKGAKAAAAPGSMHHIADLSLTRHLYVTMLHLHAPKQTKPAPKGAKAVAAPAAAAAPQAKPPKPHKPALNNRPSRFRAVQTMMAAQGEVQQQQ
jgi:hypothetical protein